MHKMGPVRLKESLYIIYQPVIFIGAAETGLLSRPDII